MKNIFLTTSVLLGFASASSGQDLVQQTIPDSLPAAAHAGFNKVSKLHRVFFGENYRREWSAQTKLPVIRISSFRGGLTPVKEGGGRQTHSLRLKDATGREWVLRSVEKFPDAILPEKLKQTFVKDIVLDAMSAQHPYSALVVPTIADAVKVPHAHPIIGMVVPDRQLGSYSEEFANTVCLLEEREPLGKSENVTQMLDGLAKENDNRFDSATFLRARILDVYLGDWDRHGDQWRFVPEKAAGGKRYIPVPRDRDQAFYTNQGVFPFLESLPWVEPFFEGFNPKIRNVGTLLFSSTLLNARFINQFSYADWMRITQEFVSAITDSVLERALLQLPASSYDLRHEALLTTLKARRDDLPRAMADYYRFLNKRAFIQLSDKNELVEMKDAPGNKMQVVIHKLSNRNEIKQPLFSKVYDPSVTKEIRVFLGKGADSLEIDNRFSPIKLRIAGEGGDKRYHVTASRRKVSVFDKKNSVAFSGDTGRFRRHLSDDSANTAVVPGNLFNVLKPMLSGGYNLDDGLMLGAGFRYTKGLDYTNPVFTAKRYTSFQEIMVAHSFSTGAVRIRYNAEWLKVAGKADVLLEGSAYAPNNTQNFFGTGNATPFDKSGNYQKYYRSRYNLYQLRPALRWKVKERSFLSVGPSFQYYHFDSSQNKGRSIERSDLIRTYDSTTIARDKLHAGVVVDFVCDTRDNSLLPASGTYITVKMQGFSGLNDHSKNYGQLLSSMAVYRSLGSRSAFVVAERFGGGATVGNDAFYQSLYLGGQGNLLGYRQYRFSGRYMMYNNLEFRMKLADFASYIMPGQLGLTGQFDIGRVWEKEDHSNTWHNGLGAGVYFAPAEMALFQFEFSHSVEGWYPYFTLGFRF
jgi:hypothetical protein